MRIGLQIPSFTYPAGPAGLRADLGRIARTAEEACNLFTYEGVEAVRRKLEVLRRHCDDLGRDYDELDRSTLSTVHLAHEGQRPGEVIAFLRELADVGVTHAIVNMPNVSEITPLEIFGREIIPELA